MTDLDQLLASPRPWAQQRAQLALDIVNQRQRGEISQDEARELIEDLARTDVLDREADCLETRTQLVSALYLLSQVV
jgi:polyhydroxyalkanoate synthesis regulator phasin